MSDSTKGLVYLGECLPGMLKTGSIEEVRALQAAGLLRYNMGHPDAIGPRLPRKPCDCDDEEEEW